jgi:hypothetical protein
MLILTSCNDNPKPECKPEIKYIDREVKVYVEKSCVVPDTNCTMNKTSYFTVVGSLLTCIVDLKRNQEVCK